MSWIAWILAVGHIACGVALALLGVWSGGSLFKVLPHMSTGNIWTNLPTVLTMALSIGAPLALIGVWFTVLGSRMWTGHPNVWISVLRTHRPLLILGCLAVAYGIIAIGAAQSSAAKGGGLMGGFGIFPLTFGVCISSMSLLSIIVAKIELRSRGFAA